jgi:transposase
LLHVGVDLAETQPHQICMMDDDRIVAEFRVPNGASGLGCLLQEINRRESDKTRVLIAVERPDGPFVGGLLDAGYTVYPINPKAIERYRERFALGGTKTDLVDARCLAGLLRTDRDAYRPIKADSPLTRELRMVTRDLSELEKTQTMLTHQLRAALYASFPAALACFGDLTAPSTLGFLKTFPTLEAARAASDEEIGQVLKRHGYSSPRRKLQRIREVLAQEQFNVDPAVVQAKRLLITTLAETLLTLHQQIHGYEKRLKELFKDHPDREIFLSLRGAGLRIAARMAAEFGEDRQRFGCAGDIAAFAGVAPVTRQSGKSKVVHFRRACCKPFREVMHQFAFCSLKWNEWAWAYYRAKRKQGKKHAETLRCLAMIWLRIIYAMWHNRTTYDEPTFLKASGRAQPEVVPVA